MEIIACDFSPVLSEKETSEIRNVILEQMEWSINVYKEIRA